MGTGEIDPVNLDDPPERQALEQTLYYDENVEQHIHSAIQSEQDLDDAGRQAGDSTTTTDARIHSLQTSEQLAAGKVVEDHQAVSQWDHDHPGWNESTTPTDGFEPVYEPDSL
jgi:hypothetical protein